MTEDAANFLRAAIVGRGSLPTDEAGWDLIATEIVTEARSSGRFVPGLGHPVHKNGDPGTPVLFRLARDNDLFGPHLELFSAIGRIHPAVLGRRLPLNGAGTCGAVLGDIDLPLGVARGFALLARCAGLLGHLAEELTTPIANDIYVTVDRNADYRPPE